MARKKRTIRQRRGVGDVTAGVSEVWGRVETGLKWVGVVLLILVLYLLWRGFYTHEWMGVETYRMLWWQEQAGEIVDLKLVQYLPAEQAVMTYAIPVDAFVDLADGYGEYQVKSILKLAEIEGRGEDLLLESMEDVFAYDIKAAVVGQGSEEADLGGLLFSQAVKTLLNPLAREESGYDMLSVWWQMRAVSEGKRYSVDLAEQNLYEEVVDVDGVEKAYLSELMVDDLINRTVPSAVDEFFPVQVVVVNTTGVSGLASQMARLITHEGYDVVRVFDSDEGLSVDEVWFGSSELEQSLAGQRLVQLVDPLVVKQVDVEGEYRADVVVKLGDGG